MIWFSWCIFRIFMNLFLVVYILIHSMVSCWCLVWLVGLYLCTFTFGISKKKISPSLYLTVSGIWWSALMSESPRTLGLLLRVKNHGFYLIVDHCIITHPSCELKYLNKYVSGSKKATLQTKNFHIIPNDLKVAGKYALPDPITNIIPVY